MPPDANNLRRRATEDALGAASRNEETMTDSTMDSHIRSLENLQGHEVAIDGIVYDLRSFDHPGGDSIFVFGGNDATIQYRMIHAHHIGNKHLEKLKRVGTIPDYQCE